MLDFIKINVTDGKHGLTVSPEFIIKPSKDLMVRGHSFYAVWDDATKLWSKDEGDVQRLVDNAVYQYVDDNKLSDVNLKLLSEFSSGKWIEWQKYCKSMPDNYHELDSKVMFANEATKRSDYATKRLSYAIAENDIPAYNGLMSVLYDPGERQKLEWGIGSIISGDSKSIQKFFVLYGGPGTGKSTFLNILAMLFEDYASIFDAKTLVGHSAFPLDAFSKNQLVSIQHDGDLSRIEDNTKMNSIISHEPMMVNEKYKTPYTKKMNTILFIGTNKSVQITDAKSGLLRRLIDVSPTGEKVEVGEYKRMMKQIPFELGGIAYRCLSVYKELGEDYYNDYTPLSMMGVTNDFYIFLEDNYDAFANVDEEYVTLKTAWARYKNYCEMANVKYPMSMRVFKLELMNYFKEFHTRYKDGSYSAYVGFKKELFFADQNEVKQERSSDKTWITLKECSSVLDKYCKDCQAQYANENEKPKKAWEKVTTVLKDLNTHELHYIRVPEYLIVIDFDIKNELGEKDLELNLREANKWPKTYAELSKGGSGLHLHYIYDGDITQLNNIYDENIEIKVFSGKSSLRRKLTKCTEDEIAHISGGLPLKERRKNVLNVESVKSEKKLRELIERNIQKEIHPGTKPSIDFIKKILDDAYNSGLKYDVSDMRSRVQTFAVRSTHWSMYCLKQVGEMKFCSDEPSDNVSENVEAPIVIFDMEVFPNVFCICWKKKGAGQPLHKMINPSPEEVNELTKYRLVGFNNRGYDNHIMYGRIMGYNEEQLYKLSNDIINDKERNHKFGEAYNLSYTDVYDFLSAQNKMSLKKWEIELGIHHKEFPYRWDEPLAEEHWEEMAEYCCNDVIATEAVWDANESDWLAREILADLADMTVNDTTNTLTTRIIVGRDPHPQTQYIYTNLADMFPGYEYNQFGIDPSRYKPGAKIVKQRSIYRGEDPGEGGRVYANPGVYKHVALLDIASMHPTSLIELQLFGKQYTARFADIVNARLFIKRKKFDEAKKLMDGKLAKYLDDPSQAKKLANALKTAINSVYGLTSARFPNKLKDERNVDNIVAKRGALFMMDLQYEVQKLGYTVVHIKTDSIKIADADDEIIQFVTDFGKKYGYTFEHEATYERMCLVNESTYIAKVAEEDGEKVTEPYWTATGEQFQVPYVFKKLFSKEEIDPSDLAETKSVNTALYLDMNEDLSDLPFDNKGNITPDDRPSKHDYRFVGKVGAFCPVISGSGGGILLREQSQNQIEKTGKRFAAVSDTKKENGEPYRWLEYEMIQELNLFEQINMAYYDEQIKKAVDNISKYCDINEFINVPVENWVSNNINPPES